ncbi:MAG: VanZ-like protein [Candidatus Yanofskybacteria bacterium GW2011_GWA1_48_10]|uniref:VanZ-like protein n=1 Tax=Candidatus Yanofskybacteria bacterium GW2011_GWA1_48_10 TaxID=1619022 RepID=A0A0G1U5A7_9BACT|nr:MAG: VanZ-like protein [Candidatus Yanofskybacteria bacterium GW2011_GWA1_48_10]
MTWSKRIQYWLPTFLWAIVIFSFSANSTPAASKIYWQDFIIKKSAHLFVYAVLAVLLYRSLKLTTHYSQPYLLLLTLALTTLYAITDEFHQSFTPGRGPHLRDIIIDVVGAGIGLYGFFLWRRS